MSVVKPKPAQSSSASSAVPPVTCPCCTKAVGSHRFAYHLQKCMNGGDRKSSKMRNSSISSPIPGDSVANVSNNSNMDKKSRMIADLEYFSTRPIIIQIKLNERGLL